MSTKIISLVSTFIALICLSLGPLSASAAVAVPTLTVVSPAAYQIFQRDASGLANITISGKYAGNTSGIVASWNGGPFTSLSSNPLTGTFSGTLLNQKAGQGMLVVRFADLSKQVTVANVGIGDIFVIAGQSNAVGYGADKLAYRSTVMKASLFGNDDQWKELKDPTDSRTNQIDVVSSDTKAGGSVYPAIATYFLAHENVPIAFIPTAKGGSTIEEWQRDALNPGNASTLYGSMYRRIQAAGGKVKAVLFWQGESAISSSITRQGYTARLNALVNNMYADFGTVMVIAQVGDDDNGAPNAAFDKVRLAQQDVWLNNPYALEGPTLYDINIADAVHFSSATELQTAAKRWWATLARHFYGGTDGSGPVVTSVKYSKSGTTVRVTFADESLPILPRNGIEGFTVKNDGIPVPILLTKRVADNELAIVLQYPVSGVIEVSLASGRTGNGVKVPRDSSPLGLPAHPFVNLLATPYGI